MPAGGDRSNPGVRSTRDDWPGGFDQPDCPIAALGLEGAKNANAASQSAGGRRRKTFSKPPVESQKPDILPNQPLSIRSLQFVLWAYAGSGFVSLAYEVVWARLISLYTVGAVYSFSIMLVVYLSGLVLGSLVGSWSMRRWKASLQAFGLLEMGVGLLAIGGLFFFNQLANLAMEDVFRQYSIEAEMAFEGVLSAITLLPGWSPGCRGHNPATYDPG